MDNLADIIRRQQEARASDDDPLVNRLLRELLLVAEEVCVLRDRLDTCERLAAAGGDCGRAAVDAFVADEAVVAWRLDGHRQFYAELFARLGEDEPT